MRLNIYLRGVDLLDIEFHCGSKGLYLDVTFFQPRDENAAPSIQQQVGDMSGTPAGSYERVEGPVWADDQPALARHPFGFH
jgi:hypothetical protein